MKRHRFGLIAIPLAMIAIASTASAQTTTTTTTVETRREPLRLSPQQRTVIYRTVRRERVPVPPADIVVRRGAIVPPVVVLQPLPDRIYAGAPDLPRYRYFYMNDQLVLVDPRTSEIVDIIDDE
jgi:hypothetical protein